MTKKIKSVHGTEKETGVLTDNASSGLIKKSGTFGALLIPNFRMLLAGSIVIYAIQWILQVTQSWLAYDLTGSGTILGTINIVTAIASLIMIPTAGIMVDRFNRRNLLLMDSALLFVITAALGLMIVAGHSNVAYLFVFAFLCSMIQTIDMTLRQVLVFNLTPRHLSPNALALNQTGWSMMRVLGPSIGGFLILWFSAGGTFLLMSGAYILIAITILRIKFPAMEPDNASAGSSAIQNIREGMQFVMGKPVILTFMLLGIIMPILAIPIFSILPPIFAVKVFGDDSGKTLGFLMASVGIGGIIGGVFTTWLKRVDHWGIVQLAAVFLLSCTFICFAFSKNLPVALLFMALSGFFEIIFLTANQTVIQLSIPEKIRGRVTSVINLTWILSPVGSMLAGAGSDLLGGPARITIVMSVMAAVIIVFIYLFSPTVRNYRLSQNT